MVFFALPCEMPRPPAVRALDQTGEYLRHAVPPLPAAAGNLPLDMIKNILTDDDLMGPFHASPL